MASKKKAKPQASKKSRQKFGNPIKRWMVYFIMVIFPVALFLVLLVPVSTFAHFKFELFVPDNMLFASYLLATAILVVVASRYAFEYIWDWGTS